MTKPPPPPPINPGSRVIPPPALQSQKVNGYTLPMQANQPAWVSVLKRCGYPATVIVIDFETYFDSEYGMGRKKTSLSTIEYVTDERFETLGCAFLTMRGDAPFADHRQRASFRVGEAEVAGHLKRLQTQYGENLEGCTVTCHNAVFDATVLWKKYNIRPKYIIDTLGLARAWNSRQHNNLDALTKRLGLVAKGDTSAFSGVTFKRRYVKANKRGNGPKMPKQRPLATDEQVKALTGYAENDAMRQWEVFTILLPRLSRPQVELQLMQHTLELFTKPRLRVDYAKGEEIIAAMEAKIVQAIPTGLTRKDISGDLSFERLLLNALESAGDHPQKYYKVGKRGYLLAIAKDDPQREILAQHPNPNVRELMAAATAIASWPNHIARVQRIMSQAKANDGYLPVPLTYCGAHTGRASGSERINLQNLGSRGDPLISSIREMLIADEDQELVIADAAAIEGRGVNWIGGQQDILDKFARGDDIYCELATKVLGIPVRKARKTDIPAIAARYTWARGIGKIGELGMGYGMGAKKAVGFAKGEIDLDTADKLVRIYRDTHPHIVRFWKDVEKAFIYTARYHRPCELRGLKFYSTADCDVIIVLPNSRELRYQEVTFKRDEYGRETPFVYNALERKAEKIWGGIITENIVQAFCRDILMDALLRVESCGIRIVHHVHDELVASVPKGKGEEALRVMLKELSVTPSWASGLPLAAEGLVTQTYGKH